MDEKVTYMALHGCTPYIGSRPEWVLRISCHAANNVAIGSKRSPWVITREERPRLGAAITWGEFIRLTGGSRPSWKVIYQLTAKEDSHNE